jgi:hypothetical protein
VNFVSKLSNTGMLVITAGILSTLVSTSAAQKVNSPAIEMGPQISQIYFPVNQIGSVQYQPSLGGLVSVKLNARLTLDFGANTTLTVPISATTMAGGRLTEASFGIRSGVHFGRVELDGKIKPGLASFGGAVLHESSNISNPQLELGRLTEPLIDLGGVLEVNISRKLAVRYDAGDTLIYYGRRIIDPAQPSTPVRLVSSLQVGAAFVFRF